MLADDSCNTDRHMQRRHLLRSPLLRRRSLALGACLLAAARLESASAFFPRDVNAADVSVGIYRFRDEDALHAALASAETAAVMADVPRFTDATVSRIVDAPL
jgi:hypothetical protein